ncbi:MAG: hypothetical protein ACRDP1_09565 [Nocardioidaceae bacterium]
MSDQGGLPQEGSYGQPPPGQQPARQTFADKIMSTVVVPAPRS